MKSIMELKNNTLLRGGTYRILKKLGQGSFGITYLAEHTALGKKVAIKEFFMKDINSRSDDGSITGITDGSFSYNYGQKFKREALNLAKLEHPNIVRVTDCFDENSTYYYVMDFIEGDNLNDYLNSHTVSENEAIAIIKDVASALAYMHDQHHMLHLDLKPGNVMRRASDGHIFLIDFGLSKNYNSDGQPETSTNIGLGTAGYAPIEQRNQAKGGEFRPTIDVYALGATLYKLLTGETPPAASDVLADKEQLSNKLNKKGISQSVTNLVMEAMEPIAKKRIPTVNEFSRRLTEPSSRRTQASKSTRFANPYTEETKVAGNHEQVEQKHQASQVAELASVFAQAPQPQATQYQQPYQLAYQQQPMGNYVETPQLGFMDSIKRCWSKYADFNGRARRSEFWWFYLAFFIISIIPYINILILALIIPYLAAMCRRLHDVGKSGHWMWLFLVFCVGGLVPLIMCIPDGNPEPNQYGESPKYVPKQ